MFELKKSNVHRIVKTETERDRLLAQGYVEVPLTINDGTADANVVTVNGVSNTVIPHLPAELEGTTEPPTDDENEGEQVTEDEDTAEGDTEDETTAPEDTTEGDTEPPADETEGDGEPEGTTETPADKTEGDGEPEGTTEPPAEENPPKTTQRRSGGSGRRKTAETKKTDEE